jgi:tight adherence protein B
VLSQIFEKKKYEKRLTKYVDFSDLRPSENKKETQNILENSSLKKVSKGIERVFNLSKYEQPLTQSGVKMSQGELFIVRVLLASMSIFVGYMLNFHLIVTIICGVIGFGLPILYVMRKRKKRLKMASNQLGEALGTMANSLRAGFSFIQTLNMVAKEVGDPLGPEFLKALQEINFGITVEEAFENLLNRLPDKELEIVLNTLVIQRSSGGNLAVLLETMQETIFDRCRVQDEVKTLTAQGKMSAVIITILPLALALYIKLVNPDYFQLLFSHPLGWVMVVIGSINIIMGWYFINKIVQIEV